MDHDSYPDSYIRGILNTVKTIAMVGISPKDVRPSYFAFKYLLERGYRMIPVNPGQVGGDILGRPVYGKLADIPEPIDMVDVFRAPQFALAIVEEALVLKPRPQVIWMQLGIRNDEAAALAEANGLKVVMNRCPKIEYGRLSSEIGWIGVNSRTLSSKRAQIFGKGVQRQGAYAYTGRDTVVWAMAQAGFNQGAWPQQVRVSRPRKGEIQDNATAVVDFKHIFQTGDLSQNYLLEEGDIIEIPPSPLAAWDMKTRRILGPLTGTAGAVTAGAQVAQPTGRTTGQ